MKKSKKFKFLSQFNWFEAPGEWSDPWSVDGHVYSTYEVLNLSKISEFKLPNTFEAMLKSFNFLMKERHGLCYQKSIIMNTPLNIVQKEYKNIQGNIDTKYLLTKWNAGMKIDINLFKNISINSTHSFHEINFIKR